jgi:hypothetical protein
LSKVLAFSSSNMPDYLGKDQRKVKGDDDKDEKPFQGIDRARIKRF